MNKPNNKFKAIFNPFTKMLAVLYGDCVSVYTFEEIEEWTKISFNGDDNHPNYLHVQLDYDECLQLLFYPRVDYDESLHEDLGVYFNSTRMQNVPEEITLVFDEITWKREFEELSLNRNVVEVERGL